MRLHFEESGSRQNNGCNSPGPRGRKRIHSEIAAYLAHLPERDWRSFLLVRAGSGVSCRKPFFSYSRTSRAHNYGVTSARESSLNASLIVWTKKHKRSDAIRSLGPFPKARGRNKASSEITNSELRSLRGGPVAKSSSVGTSSYADNCSRLPERLPPLQGDHSRTVTFQ